jgi:hypothetical protein
MDVDRMWYRESQFGFPGPPGHRIYFLWGYVRNAVFITQPPTDIPKPDLRIMEAVSSVIWVMHAKVCDKTGYRTNRCRMSLGTQYPGSMELRRKFHRFFHDLRLSSIINAILISMDFENICIFECLCRPVSVLLFIEWNETGESGKHKIPMSGRK